jgi:hypothetical protein
MAFFGPTSVGAAKILWFRFQRFNVGTQRLVSRLVQAPQWFIGGLQAVNRRSAGAVTLPSAVHLC